MTGGYKVICVLPGPTARSLFGDSAVLKMTVLHKNHPHLGYGNVAFGPFVYILNIIWARRWLFWK